MKDSKSTHTNGTNCRTLLETALNHTSTGAPREQLRRRSDRASHEKQTYRL